ncbi:thrombin inhibitor hemalin-like [Larus michahellis]|uniref:thrombin inhibitor hemalin-like n=1 Tax=Larus michahellis TaxID=119627 RepID=UPI003D9AF01D
MAAGRFFPLLLALLSLPTDSQARPGSDGTPLPELCRLPLVVGRCRASVPRWWFNGSAGVCQSFVYGGCDGNANSFPGERECRDACVPLKPWHRSDPTDTSYDEHCAAPRVTGPCRAAFPRWFYTPANQTCQEFIYGGCRGNKNNFQSREECLRRCRPEGGDAGADFHGVFLPVKALALAVLLVMPAAFLVGYVVDVALKTCRRRKREGSAPGMPWRPDDKEYLMSNGDTL